MDKGLVHVENQNFLLIFRPRGRQVDQLILYAFLSHNGQVILNEVQGLEGVLEVLSVEVHFQSISVFVDLRVSFGHLCYEATEDVVLLRFVLFSLLEFATISLVLAGHLSSLLLL